MIAYIDKATDADIDHICEHMRDIDKRELWAAFQMSPTEVLSHAGECHIGHVDGSPAVVFGCQDGIVWMLATDDIKKVGVRFILRSQDIISEWLEQYRHIYNYVHIDNHISIRWLKWLGFTIHPPAPYGALGELFHLFEKRWS
jgi:hypothetical protein